MAYEYLGKTTYTDQLAEQEEMLAYLQENASELREDVDTIDDVDPELLSLASSVVEEQSDPEIQEQEAIEDEADEEDLGASDMEFLNFLFSEKSTSSSGMIEANNVLSENVSLDWLKRKSDKVKLNGLNPSISKYLTSLPEDLRSSLVATSGNDDKHSKNSLHYNNNAIDLRFNQRAYEYIKNDPVAKKLGINLLNPNHGTAPHLHLETKKTGGVVGKYKFGGNTLYATTSSSQRIGLNDSRYDSAVFSTEGVNTFRGLDNNQPVAVTDGSKYKVLYGKYDTAQFTGKVYEKKL